MNAAALLPIGEVADSTGVAVSTVRYYDEIGVITAAARVGGKRRFDTDTVGRVSFIRRAQEAGFSLDEIRALLDDTQGGWRNLVEDKLAELSKRRERLDAMIVMLGEIAECGCEVVVSCSRPVE
ncbi:MAG: MerR family transcriptional regulator [Acidimicrobiia bacterium]|nr:MAG: MerR family transcriptional regulator [Acidimicrobiia bacterium]